MWLVFGIAAILFAVLNVLRTVRNNDAKWFRFISMSFTLLAMCSFYSDGANRVLREDWGGLMDIMPTMNKVLWVCSLASILMNSISLFKENE